MREVIGTNNRILEIDLTAKKFLESSVNTKDRDMYWGGKGLALKLLYDRLEPGVDPLGEKYFYYRNRRAYRHGRAVLSRFELYQIAAYRYH